MVDVNRRAAFVVADGITLVWASWWKGLPLPERVTGADLIFGLCELAALHGYRVFLLGGGPSVTETAAPFDRPISGPVHRGGRISAVPGPGHRRNRGGLEPDPPGQPRSPLRVVRPA